VLGLLLFPILPVTWEVAAWRRRRRAKGGSDAHHDARRSAHAAHARGDAAIPRDDDARLAGAAVER